MEYGLMSIDDLFGFGSAELETADKIRSKEKYRDARKELQGLISKPSLMSEEQRVRMAELFSLLRKYKAERTIS